MLRWAIDLAKEQAVPVIVTDLESNKAFWAARHRRCQQVEAELFAGVSRDEWVRISVLDLGKGTLLVRPIALGPLLECQDELPSQATDDQLGSTALDQLRRMSPTYRMVARASLETHAYGGVVLLGNRQVWSVSTDDPGGLAVALADALAPDQPAEGLDVDRLVEIGLTPDDLAGGALIAFTRFANGAIEVRGLVSDGPYFRTVGDPIVTAPHDIEGAAAAAVAKLVELPTRHRAPGQITGVRFGFKTTWLAVRDATPEAVVTALGLTDVRAMSWDQGIESSYQDGVFVTPKTAGWVLAVGVGSGGMAEVTALSARLGTEVQFFASYRGWSHYTWVLARHGVLVRGFDTNDGETSAFGDATAAEAAVGEYPNEADVLRVAEAWSLNPMRLDTIQTASDRGLFGQLPKT
jgi:hypothetical protein